MNTSRCSNASHEESNNTPSISDNVNYFIKLGKENINIPAWSAGLLSISSDTISPLGGINSPNTNHTSIIKSTSLRNNTHLRNKILTPSLTPNTICTPIEIPMAQTLYTHLDSTDLLYTNNDMPFIQHTHTLLNPDANPFNPVYINNEIPIVIEINEGSDTVDVDSEDINNSQIQQHLNQFAAPFQPMNLQNYNDNSNDTIK